MSTSNSKMRKGVVILLLAVAGFHSPVGADGVGECANDVLDLCAETLEDCNWIEKVAVGAACAAMLAGCSLEMVNLSVSL
jgi:hypothetical protein